MTSRRAARVVRLALIAALAGGWLMVDAAIAQPYQGRPGPRERMDRSHGPGPGQREEWRDRRGRGDGGSMSKEERRELQRDLNRANREIYRQPPPGRP
jgi:uncharacterized membrane protein